MRQIDDKFAEDYETAIDRLAGMGFRIQWGSPGYTRGVKSSHTLVNHSREIEEEYQKRDHLRACKKPKMGPRTAQLVEHLLAGETLDVVVEEMVRHITRDMYLKYK